MLKFFKTAFPAIIFFSIGVFLWKGLHNNPHRILSPLIDKVFPAFELPNLMIPNQTLTQVMFKGHVSLLNVFASWCLYCLSEHAVIMDIARHAQVKVYGLNYKDTRLEATQWLQNYGNPFSGIIFDTAGTLAINLGVYGTPETFIIDANGVIRYKYVGPVTPQVWRHTLYPEIQKWSSHGRNI